MFEFLDNTGLLVIMGTIIASNYQSVLTNHHSELKVTLNFLSRELQTESNGDSRRKMPFGSFSGP